jgi:hypothetical protein
VKRSLRCRCVVVLVVSVVTGALASGSAMASELSWSAPQRIDATESPRLYPSPVVSCASASFCVAVDQNSNALTYNGSSWTSPASIKGSYPFELRFTSVSCPTTAFCVAVGEGQAVNYSAGSWSQPSSIDAIGGLLAVSCPSATFCAAVDSGGNALTYNGSSWTAPSHIDTTAEGIGSVSCASSSFCIAADYEGKTMIYNGSAWTTPADTTEPEGIGGLSCASSSFCAAIDWSGNVLTYNGSAWSTPTNIGSAAAVSCLSSSFCVAVGINGNAHIYNGSAWTTEAGVISPSEGDGLACASSSFCIATDMRGYAVTFAEHESAGGGGGSNPPPSGGGGSTAPSGSVPSDTTPRTGVVALSKKTIAVQANGTALVPLDCTGTATCQGTVTLTASRPAAPKDKRARLSKTRTIGRARFAIAAGKTATVKVKLNATGRAMLKAHHGKLTATLTITKSLPTPASTARKTVHIVQKVKH